LDLSWAKVTTWLLFKTQAKAAPAGANIVKLSSQSYSTEGGQMSSLRGLLSSLFGQGDDMAAFENARYTAQLELDIIKRASFSSSSDEVI
jgi:hypothetical protein